MPRWDPQTEAEIQHMAGVISTAFRHADDDDDDDAEQSDLMVLEPPSGFNDPGQSLKAAKHRRESYEIAIHDNRGRPSLTGSDASSARTTAHHHPPPPPVPPKPPKLTVIAKFAQYSQSIRDNSFDLSDMDLRVFDERSYSDIQQTIRETCHLGLDRVTSSENMSSASEDPLDLPEIAVKKVTRQATLVNAATETATSSSTTSTLGREERTAVSGGHNLPSPSLPVAEPLDIADLVDIPDVPEEFRDAVPVSEVPAVVERAEPEEYQAWKAQMRELEQLTGAKSSNEPSPVTPVSGGSSHRGGGVSAAATSTSQSSGGGYRGFTRRTPIGSTWLYRATSSDPDWEDSETSASDSQQQPTPSTSRGRGRTVKTTTPTSSTPPKST